MKSGIDGGNASRLLHILMSMSLEGLSVTRWPPLGARDRYATTGLQEEADVASAVFVFQDFPLDKGERLTNAKNCRRPFQRVPAPTTSHLK